MPRIINAYSGNESVADSLKSLGDSMFGNQAQRELIRENALSKQRENTNVPLLADAVRNGDRNALAYYGVLANKTGADASNYNLLSTANHATGVDDPGLATAQLGAHEPIASTAVGQGRQLENQSNIAGMQMDRQVQQQQWTDEHTLVNLRGPDGKITMVPKSQVGNLQAHGYDVVPTKEQAIGDLLSPQQPTPQPDATASVAPPTAPASPRASRLSALTPDQRSLVGLPTQVQSYQHPQTGEVATSQDGGQTLTKSDGSRVPANGSGFMPVSHEAALQQVQQNNIRTQASQPPAATPDPAQSAAAQDARATAGIGPEIAEHANTLVGATGLGAVGNYLFGTPEVAPSIERARSAQDIRNNEARTALLASPGRQAIQQQKWVNDLLPQDHAMANPETEAQKVPQIVGALKADLDNERRVVQDINTPAPERIAANQRMHKLTNAIRLFTAPPEGATPAASQAAPAPQQQAPVTKTIGGKTYFQQNGQWFEQ